MGGKALKSSHQPLIAAAPSMHSPFPHITSSSRVSTCAFQAPGGSDSLPHSEGESLRKGEKKRLGRRSSPQNGRFGGRATSCEGTEEHTIDQACILGRPAQFTSWARSLWNLMRAVRSPQLTRHALWADPIGGPTKGKMLNFFCLKSTSRPKYQSV